MKIWYTEGTWLKGSKRVGRRGEGRRKGWGGEGREGKGGREGRGSGEVGKKGNRNELNIM